MRGTQPAGNPSLAIRCCAAILACCCTVGAPRAPKAADRSHVCPGPGCEPNCPVRPAHFGHYTTQWRRWPGSTDGSGAATDAATPEAPPRSVVPGSDEESPRQRIDDLPTPDADAPAATPSGEGADKPREGRLDRGRRITEVAREFEACRGGPPDRQAAFTSGLVAFILSEQDPEVRAWIVQLAAEFDTADASAIRTGALADPDPKVRMAACTAVARRSDPRGVGMLAERVRDDADLGVRLRALKALGEHADAAAPAAVAAALDDPDPAIRARALQVLRRRSGRDFGDDVAAWRNWANDPQGTATGWSPAAWIRRLF